MKEIYYNATVDVEVPVDPVAILDELDIWDVVDYYGVDKVLDEIGKKDCLKHFGIEE